MDGVRTVNRGVFLSSVFVTGAVAGAFVWLLLFLMNLGITFIWDRVPVYLGSLYPLVMCAIGGIIIGLFTKRYGPYPDDMMTVLAKVKRDGRYGYEDLGPMSAGALLPMVFGGSVGPEAGLVGAIAAICTWVSERLKRFGSQFRELTEAGVYAAISAIFTAPLYGFAGGIGGKKVYGSEDVHVSKMMRALIYVFAIAGALITFLLLSKYIGGGLSLPRYTDIVYGVDEFIWLIPVVIVGSIAGWLFCVLDVSFKKVSDRFGDRHVLKATMGGLALGLCGMVLPFTMFAGEVQAEELNEIWMTLSIAVLLATGFVKIAITALGVNLGWRGGHFFPVIFSGISIGYGLSMAIGIDPVFCVCATTAAVVGGVMRRPVMAILLLFLCFPVHSILVLAIAATIGSLIPLPGSIKKEMHGHSDDGSE